MYNKPPTAAFEFCNLTMAAGHPDATCTLAY